eukprot:271496-Amphidinium_carterae.1
MSNLWWSCLIPSTGLLCKQKGTDCWWFLLGFDWAPCFIGVPSVPLGSSHPMRFKLQSLTVETVQYFFFYAPDSYEVVPVQLVAPQNCGAGAGEESGLGAIVFEADGAPSSLLQWAARKAFYKLPKAVLNRIANKIGAVIDGTSLFDCLLGLVRCILPELSEQEIVRIIETRVVDKGHYAEVLTWLRAEGSEFLDEEDKELLKKDKDKEQKNNDDDDDDGHQNEDAPTERMAFRQSLHQFKQNVLSKHSGKPSASSASKKKRRFGPVPDWQAKEVKEQQLQNILPDEFHIYGDSYNKRWMLSWHEGTVKQYRSRSWKLHGVNVAAKLLIAHAWYKHKELSGEDCPIAVEAKPLD